MWGGFAMSGICHDFAGMCRYAGLDALPVRILSVSGLRVCDSVAGTDKCAIPLSFV